MGTDRWEHLSSTQNPLLKRVARLHQKRARDREGVFLIEGQAELGHALATGVQLETVLCCPEWLGVGSAWADAAALNQALVEAGQAPALVTVAAGAFGKIAYRAEAAVVAVAQRPRRELADLVLPERAFVLVIEAVEKPGNLGALLRTADAVGVDAVVVCASQVDLYNPNVVRASLGALFTVPVVTADNEAAAAWLAARGVAVLVTTPGAEMLYDAIDCRGPVALVLGSEKDGVSRFWPPRATHCVRIPMRGRMDSLNLSCSGAVMMYEVLRQRRRETA